MNFYKTIQNLIDCGLATKEELIKAYAKTGKKLPVPKETFIQGDMKYTSTNINSADFLFYKAVQTK